MADDTVIEAHRGRLDARMRIFALGTIRIPAGETRTLSGVLQRAALVARLIVTEDAVLPTDVEAERHAAAEVLRRMGFSVQMQWKPRGHIVLTVGVQKLMKGPMPAHLFCPESWYQPFDVEAQAGMVCTLEFTNSGPFPVDIGAVLHTLDMPEVVEVEPHSADPLTGRKYADDLDCEDNLPVGRECEVCGRLAATEEHRRACRGEVVFDDGHPCEVCGRRLAAGETHCGHCNDDGAS